VGQLLVTKGVKAIAAGRKEKKLTVIQAQIDRELAALRGGK
jgi:NADP-dependent 3-hydroxy acid dehydrogenase YdfG